jgi:hypothetical protein
MNFIGRMEGQEIQVELKYCERCGGLWLRPRASAGVYCASCQACLAALPERGEEVPQTRRRRKARTPGGPVAPERLLNSSRIESLEGVASVGRWA